MGKHILFDGQKHLYKLFKELDEICKRNGIRYYLAGGSAIGAVRHGGFIPWDDDMDIMMFREDWEKLLALPQEEFPPNRVISAQETDREYFNSFGRYADTSTTAIHRHQIIQDDVAGSVIDILVMDPVPDEAYDRYLKDLMLYSDLINDSLVYSIRYGLSGLRYSVYSKLRSVLGKEWVLSRLEKRMFTYPKNSKDTYAMRWAGIPFKFQGDMFAGDEVRSEPFEDLEGEVPTRLSDYLVWHYGDNWMYIPPHGEREGHNAVFDMRVPYTVIRQDYRKFIDVKKVERLLTKRKKAIFHNARAIRRAKRRSLEMSAEAYGLFYTDFFAQREKDIETARDEGDFARLFSLFEPYLKKQLSRPYSGREDYVGVERFLDPVIVPIPRRYHELVLRTLFENGMFPQVSRLADMYVANDHSEEKDFAPLLEELKRFRHANSIADSGHSEEALRILLELHKAHPTCIEIVRRVVYLAGSMPNQREVVRTFVALGQELAPTDGFFKKFETDLRFPELSLEALYSYIEAYESTEHGFVLKDITELIERHESLLLEGLHSAEGDEYARVRNLVQSCLAIVPTMEKLTLAALRSDIDHLEVPRDLFEDSAVVTLGHAALMYTLENASPEGNLDLLVAYWQKLGFDAESALLRARYSTTDVYDLTELESLASELRDRKATRTNELTPFQQMHLELMLARLSYELVDYQSMDDSFAALSRSLNERELTAAEENLIRQDIKTVLRTQIYMQTVLTEGANGSAPRTLPGERMRALEALCELFGLSYSRLARSVGDDLLVLLTRETRVNVEPQEYAETEQDEPDADSDDEASEGDDALHGAEAREPKVLTLRREVEAVCAEHDIQFFAFGSTAGRALTGSEPTRVDYYSKLMVPAAQYLTLVKLLREKAQESPATRAVDAFTVNKNYPSITCRYVDTTSTAFNLNKDASFAYCGKYIEIVPLRDDGRASFKKWFFESLELGWADARMPSRHLSNPKTLARMVAVSAFASLAGKKRFQAWLLRQFTQFACGNSSFGWSYLESGKRKTHVNIDPFSAVETLDNGVRVSRILNPVQRSYTAVAPPHPEHLLVSEDVPFSVLFAHFDERKLSYRSFYREQRMAAARTLTYRGKSREKNRIWKIVQRSGDRLDMQLLYARRMDLINRLEHAKDYPRLAYIMQEHQHVTRRYIDSQLGFAVNEELATLQVKLFRLMGDNERAKKLEKLVNEDLLTPIITSEQVAKIQGADSEA